MWPESDECQSMSMGVAQKLRDEGKNVTVWLQKDTKLDKQLKYADKMGIKYVVIVGDKELKDNSITIKNLKTGKQEKEPIQ